MIDYSLLFVAILGGVYLYRADFEQYSVFTVGVFKRISRYESSRNIECANVDCDNTTEGSELRKAYKEIIVCGAVIARYDKTSNRYCYAHTSFEFRNEDIEQTKTRRLAESLIAGIVGFAEWKAEDTYDDESKFSQVTTNTSNAFDLLPVVLIVLLMAIILAPIAAWRKDTVNP